MAGAAFCVGLSSLNAVAYRQAWVFTHFAPPGPRTKAGQLSLGDAARLLIDGVRIPRPENRRTPADVGLAYERHVFAGGRGIALEAWLVPCPDARVADDDLRPAAIVVECPFDTLIGAVRHRFSRHGLPSFPLADLLVFWGGAQEGFDALGFRPVDLAPRVRVPTLLMNGDQDEWVRVEEARAIFDALPGPKTLHFFAGVGHDSGLRNRPDEWKAVVGDFLENHVDTGRGGVAAAEVDPPLSEAGRRPGGWASSARASRERR